MKAPRGKRSEGFWPSTVMKKWLNIRPKNYEFDKDEAEADNEAEREEEDGQSETENEARSQKEMQWHVAEDLPNTIRKGSPSESESQTGTQPKRPFIKHRRGNSETLRAQYINTKDVRVTIGTWNVAGRPPHEDLEIDEWISMEEPSDIYILGFQEVVPLSAGNVLGVETSTPILQWESVIRRTLNKLSQPDPIPKSYSAPHSPVYRRTAADLLVDIDGIPALDRIAEEPLSSGDASDYNQSQKLPEMIGMGKKSYQRSYSINQYSRLNWPEPHLEVAPLALSSGAKLQRALSSTARDGSEWMDTAFFSSKSNTSRLNWPELPLEVASHALSSVATLKRASSDAARDNSEWMDHSFFSPKSNAVGRGVDLEKVQDSSGSIGSILNNPAEDQPEVCNSFADVLNQCEEPEVDLDVIAEMEHENALFDDGVKSKLKYIRIVSKQMVGIYISVWVRRRLRKHINNLKVSPVGVGLMGYMGNKGSVSVSMSVYQTRLCFVCSHLASGHKEGYEQRRNANVYEIIRRTHFSSAFDTHQPLTIPAHDQVFWFGDLNYRINMSDARIMKLVSMKQWNELLNSDQLINELRDGVFDGWEEGVISFPPTYKYGFNSDAYVGENRKEGEKKRSPAWCDRILWLGKGIKQLSYNRAEMWISDHRPVSSDFLITVEVFERRKLQKALIVTSAVVHPDVPDILGEED